MRIGEVAEITGLSISNIRFYEKKGLIGPDRDAESKYRNYSDEDLKRIRFIVLLRKMDIPVETIGSILSDKISFEDVLRQQLSDLEHKQQTIHSSMELCQKMIDDQAFRDIDIDYYSGYVKEEEAKGKIYAGFNDLLDDFSGFTKFDYFMSGSPKGMWLLSHPGIYKAVRIIWCVMIMILPVIGILDDLLDQNGVSGVMILFWVLWEACFLTAFVGYHKRLKNNSNRI